MRHQASWSRASRGVMLLALLVCAPAMCAQAPAVPAEVTDLQSAFRQPPDDARIMMRWWWFGPSVTKAELEKELLLMREGGIGGVEVQPVYPLVPDDPAGGFANLPLLSNEFIEALKFTADKARELGMRVDLTLGSGWPYGGPNVPISQAAGRLRCDRIRVAPGVRRVPLPSLTSGEKLIAVFMAQAQEKGLVAGTLSEITSIRDKQVMLPAGLTGAQELLFFISSRTGMMVKRASVGAEGFVLDHYDRGALDGYLKTVGDRLMQAFSGQPPYAIFCDSLEVFGSDWTPDFLAQFQKRRGYDLRPLLPALVEDLGGKTAAIRQDWGKTLTELANENFITPLREWARQHGTRLRMQGYGIPPATLSSNALVDLPEGEGSQWKILRPSRWAASASHLYGRPVTSSETWTWLHSPVFRATPLDLKAEADLHFLQGINQLIGHGWPYTAPGVDYPGWRFYAAGVFNEKNPWWLVMPDLARYLQRISFLMRQGRPVADVALYLPNHDAWASITLGRAHLLDILRERLGPQLIACILEAGFGFDFVDDAAIEQLGTIENRVLAMGGNRYKIVVLPGVERIPLAVYRKLEQFVRNGGTLVATRRTPMLAPGFAAAASANDEVRLISNRLFIGTSANPTPQAYLAREENQQLVTQLVRLMRPDVALDPPAPDIGFVHRSAGQAEIYFLANTSNRRQGVKASFRVGGMRPEWWDPLTGAIRPAEVQARPMGATVVQLEMEPYGSRVLVFSKAAAAATAVPPAGRGAAGMPAPLDLSTNWKVTFGNGGPIQAMVPLRSWTDDEDTRFFSGVAYYEKEVSLPEDFLQSGLEVRLDLGEGRAIPETPVRNGMQAWYEGPVREAAVVYVNGKRAGSAWCPPYSVVVSGLLVPGLNRLQLAVGNLAVNHMAGRPLPDYRLLNLRYGLRFEPQDMDKLQPVSAGLFGPIQLRTSPR